MDIQNVEIEQLHHDNSKKSKQIDQLKRQNQKAIMDKEIEEDEKKRAESDLQQQNKMHLVCTWYIHYHLPLEDSTNIQHIPTRYVLCTMYIPCTHNVCALSTGPD